MTLLSETQHNKPPRSRALPHASNFGNPRSRRCHTHLFAPKQSPWICFIAFTIYFFLIVPTSIPISEALSSSHISAPNKAPQIKHKLSNLRVRLAATRNTSNQRGIIIPSNTGSDIGSKINLKAFNYTLQFLGAVSCPPNTFDLNQKQLSTIEGATEEFLYQEIEAVYGSAGKGGFSDLQLYITKHAKGFWADNEVPDGETVSNNHHTEEGVITFTFYGGADFEYSPPPTSASIAYVVQQALNLRMTTLIDNIKEEFQSMGDVQVCPEGGSFEDVIAITRSIGDGQENVEKKATANQPNNYDSIAIISMLFVLIVVLTILVYMIIKRGKGRFRARSEFVDPKQAPAEDNTAMSKVAQTTNDSDEDEHSISSVLVGSVYMDEMSMITGTFEIDEETNHNSRSVHFKKEDANKVEIIPSPDLAAQRSGNDEKCDHNTDLTATQAMEG